MYPTLCKVQFWNENSRELSTDYALIYAETYVEAASKMEDYYGDTMESLTIQMYDIGVWRVDEDIAAKLMENM